MPLFRHSMGTYPETSTHATRQSSQLAEPQWIDRGIKSGINVRELISTLKKGGGRREMNGRTFSQNAGKRE